MSRDRNKRKPRDFEELLNREMHPRAKRRDMCTVWFVCSIMSYKSKRYDCRLVCTDQRPQTATWWHWRSAVTAWLCCQSEIKAMRTVSLKVVGLYVRETWKVRDLFRLTVSRCNNVFNWMKIGRSTKSNRYWIWNQNKLLLTIKRSKLVLHYLSCFDFNFKVKELRTVWKLALNCFEVDNIFWFLV